MTQMIETRSTDFDRRSVDKTARVSATKTSVNEPPGLRLSFSDEGELKLHSASGAVQVHAKPCFPWSRADALISLVDAKGEEVAFIEEPSFELDASSMSSLERALKASHYVLHVLKVLSVEEDYELRRWKVETPLGVRLFQTKLDEWPQAVPGSAYLIQDVSGDLYRLPPVETLDESSRKILWAYVE